MNVRDHILRAVPLAVAVMMAACGGGADTVTEPPPVTLDGAWQAGAMFPGNIADTLRITLSQSGSQVSGSGWEVVTRVQNGAVQVDSGAFAVSGTFANPTAALTFTSPTTTTTYDGTLANGDLIGAITTHPPAGQGSSQTAAMTFKRR